MLRAIALAVFFAGALSLANTPARADPVAPAPPASPAQPSSIPPTPASGTCETICAQGLTAKLDDAGKKRFQDCFLQNLCIFSGRGAPIANMPPPAAGNPLDFLLRPGQSRTIDG
jgi:hypothetical protein